MPVSKATTAKTVKTAKKPAPKTDNKARLDAMEANYDRIQKIIEEIGIAHRETEKSLGIARLETEKAIEGMWSAHRETEKAIERMWSAQKKGLFVIEPSGEDVKITKPVSEKIW